MNSSPKPCFEEQNLLHVWVKIQTTDYNYDPPPSRPWGEGGHLNLLWFPVTQMSVHVHLYQNCLRYISYSYSPIAFKLSDMVTMDKTLN